LQDDTLYTEGIARAQGRQDEKKIDENIILTIDRAEKQVIKNGEDRWRMGTPVSS
jgi:hypothetical protein